MADQRSPSLLEQQRQGERWIDSINEALEAQTELFVSGLRLWRRLFVASVDMSAGVVTVAARAAARGAGEAASSATEAASRTSESLSETLAEATRTARKAEKEQRPVSA